jgi:hypothetical protein
MGLFDKKSILFGLGRLLGVIRLTVFTLVKIGKFI